MTNVLRHAGARRAGISVLVEGDALRISVTDDGAGFDPARLSGRAEAHKGLLGMRERTELAGGTLAVESAPGRGTAVRAVLPLSPAAPS